MKFVFDSPVLNKCKAKDITASSNERFFSFKWVAFCTESNLSTPFLFDYHS